jgi:hypothetical protein
VDSNPAFSLDEQASISLIWSRVAEDYSPFDVDVTTEAPLVRTLTTAHVVITRGTDLRGVMMPSGLSGGMAYLSVFGEFDSEFVSFPFYLSAHPIEILFHLLIPTLPPSHPHPPIFLSPPSHLCI